MMISMLLAASLSTSCTDVQDTAREVMRLRQDGKIERAFEVRNATTKMISEAMMVMREDSQRLKRQEIGLFASRRHTECIESLQGEGD
jgi:hypothetical protein